MRCLCVMGTEKEDIEAHECNPDDVASAQAVRRDAKPCPKCSMAISKIDGCDQMWCVGCKTAFSWRTGKIQTGVIHNPHFFEWQRNGGRLMYLGGNGFYWRVSFSDEWPGAIELRRAEDGVRNWQTGDGENYHVWGGEYGGLWRRNGRAPNQLVGIGFAAQGFEKATHYVVGEHVRESRASWILAGIDDDLVGTSGLGGGAAGQEVDRYDQRLGSPGHAVIIATATEFGPDMLRTKEEFEGTVAFPSPDPYVRADIVFFETPMGGAVFSVGSISWFGALARNGYDNDVARMTKNVLERFLDPKPFVVPEIGVI